MFRELRRKKQETTREECFRILKECTRGVLAVSGDDGYPYAIPINYYFDELDGCIYIHCGKQGHKTDAINACDKVCFTVWDQGYRDPGDWAYHVTSVICMGRAAFLTADTDKEKLCRELKSFGMKYFPLEEEAEVDRLIEKEINAVQMIVITPEHITGKRIYEK